MMKFDNIQKFGVVLKIWLKIDIFEKDLRRMKFGKILTFFSRVKHLDQNWHFDHSEHGKDEILQNLEIFSRSENLAQIES